MKSVAQELFDAAFSKPRDARSAEYKQGVLDILRHRLCEQNSDFKVGRYVAGTAQADAYWAGNDEGRQLAREYLNSADVPDAPSEQAELFFANEDGRIDISKAADRFSERCAALIREKLPGNQRQFALMPYRRPFGHEFIGFDWSDETGATLGFTINYGSGAQLYLPDPVWPHVGCIAAQDATDAHHLCRLIAKRVLGNSTGMI